VETLAYFKIGSTDLSSYVNELKVIKAANYTAQTNAAGNTVVDYINSKRTIEVGIIPLSDAAMKTIQNAIGSLNVNVSFRNPQTGTLEENIKCIIPENEITYYTIQANKVLYNAFTLKFIEL
jgi:hypothetical protein